ncbi:MAG: DoxX family membrane protein [Deltaproteobacteria bacterium]|nr:DoxX family membrane protein [Deltaproteobacteria bacterium]
MSRSLPERGAVWVLKLFLAVVWLWAGIAKLGDPAGFAEEIANYQLLPWVAPYVASILPGVEIVLGLALLLPPWTRMARASALLTTGAMAGFTFAVTTVVARGIDISCGCFGTGTGPVTGLTVLRDVALTAAAAAALWLSQRAAREREG